jgi:hypothetical protein
VQLTSIHLGWGFVGWGVLLLAAVAFVVVPMFQMTPPTRAWFAGAFSGPCWCCWALWSVATGAAWQWPVGPGWRVRWCSRSPLLPQLTLQVQRRSKRARFDATQHYWRVGMLCALAACTLWFAASARADTRRAPGVASAVRVLALLAASCR